MICYIVINNFFVSFEMSVESYKFFAKYFETNKRIQQMYPIFHGKFDC